MRPRSIFTDRIAGYADMAEAGALAVTLAVTCFVMATERLDARGMAMGTIMATMCASGAAASMAHLVLMRRGTKGFIMKWLTAYGCIACIIIGMLASGVFAVLMTFPAYHAARAVGTGLAAEARSLAGARPIEYVYGRKPKKKRKKRH